MEIININTYQEFKQAFGDEVRKQSEGFIRIGYLLKRARDTDILAGSGYKTIAEFAWAEYHFTEDVVSRMIHINDRYSVGGYSDQLQEKYRACGMSLLAEMLTLPEEVVDVLPPGTTRQEIRQIKSEIREEARITDLEVLLEGEKPELKELESKLEKFLYQYFQENREKYGDIHRAVNGGPDKEGQVFNELAPSGIATLITRIQGMGKYMLSVKGKEIDLELLNIRDNSKDTFTWEECISVVSKLCPVERQPEEAWETLYGVPVLKTEEAASIIQEAEQAGEMELNAETKAEAEAEAEPEAESGQEPEPESELEPKPEAGPELELEGVLEQQAAEPEQSATESEQQAAEPEQQAAESEQQAVESEQVATELERQWQQAEQVRINHENAPAQVERGKDVEEEGASEDFHQTNIEDFDEILPDGYIKCHDGSEVTRYTGHMRTRYEALTMAESISEMAVILSQADDRNWFEWLEEQCER